MATKPNITHAELLRVLDYNPKTGEFRWKWRSDRAKRWNTRWAGKIAGTIAFHGYRIISYEGKKYRAHRLAWFYETSEWPKDEIDHRERNPLDNRFEKIREATPGENKRNCKKYSNNKSGIKGVFWDKSIGRWCANIRKDGKQIYLGSFANIEDAARVRWEAANRMFGEFVNHG